MRLCAGYDPRRNSKGSRPWPKRELFRQLIECNPDGVLALMEHVTDDKGVPLLDKLVNRFYTRERREPRLGWPKWKTGGRRP